MNQWFSEVSQCLLTKMRKALHGGTVTGDVKERYEKVVAKHPPHRKGKHVAALAARVAKRAEEGAERGGERGAERGARAAIQLMENMLNEVHDRLLGPTKKRRWGTLSTLTLPFRTP